MSALLGLFIWITGIRSDVAVSITLIVASIIFYFLAEYAVTKHHLYLHGIETSMFIDKCQRHLEISRRVSEHVSYHLEEQIVRKEESIINKSASLAILSLGNSMEVSPINYRGIADDTHIALNMIDEIKQTYIPVENLALNALRCQLLDLSFLPK